MATAVAIYGVTAGLVLLLWYLVASHWTHRKARQVLEWVRAALDGHGELGEVTWLSASRVRAAMVLRPATFQRTWLTIRLKSYLTPVHCALALLRPSNESVAFHVDLDQPPEVALYVRNYRWCGNAKTQVSGRAWQAEQIGPFVLSSREEWRQEVTAMLHALAASRECDLLDVRFRRTSPHFSVSVPLASLAPSSRTAERIFDALRELATGSSASKF